MFPIAWVVVKVESKDTWSWFLKNLMADLEITNGGGWAFMSDQQKGLLPALAELMPFAEHRMCARYIYANWTKIYKGEKLQKQFWMIAKSTNMADFRIHKQQLLDLTKDGYEALFQTEPRHWCKAFFSEEFKSDIIDNNLSEAFNGRILEARCKPIISMLEDIQVIVMTRLQKQRDEAAKWTGQCGPRIAKRLDDNLASSRFCHPIWNGDDGYEDMEKTDKYVVQLDKLKCSCRAWQLSGIPCIHAIFAIQAKYHNPKDYLHGCYHKSTYLAAYQHMMQPIRSTKFWEPTNHEAPHPLPLKKQMGRPKRRRRKQEGEPRSKKMSRVRCRDKMLILS
ncbi:uncharacterized protein LOC130138412 [Syzygium oleosum]|uniref:uncharacterized protein LOC130138412 n=1 Tax=Syzygium oleosum TaxID=219896 RepID=UPI0024B8B877|nr:uncharacterized protein LOC130138412 [Syzygium oleosum]